MLHLKKRLVRINKSPLLTVVFPYKVRYNEKNILFFNKRNERYEPYGQSSANR